MTAPGTSVVEPELSESAPPRRLRPPLLAAVLVVVLLLTAIVFFRWGSAGSGSPTAAPTASPAATAVEAMSTADVYAALQPSVVTIESVSRETNDVDSIGTGVIANVDGLILTALHVVSGQGSIRVTFADGTTSTATVLAAEPEIDIATIVAATLPGVLVPAILGNSARLSVGDDVVAIGNQLGLTSSATAGVVSGLNRGAAGRDGSDLAGLIQFDAAVNPGSSGGPLVNTMGETIGIVVALANPTTDGTFIGIGFAVPIGTAIAPGGDDGPPQ